ncbi:hypothetical protein Q9189_003565 [Teloschistes chrysophthalmus]
MPISDATRARKWNNVNSYLKNGQIIGLLRQMEHLQNLELRMDWATEEDLVHFIERHAMSREIGVGNKEGAQDITEQYIQPNTYLSDKRGQEEQILEIWHPFRAAIQSGSSSAGQLEIMANAPHNDLDDDLFHTRDTFKKKPRRSAEKDPDVDAPN